MFSKNQETIPSTLSKTIFFDLLNQIGLHQEDLEALDENLVAHGYSAISEIKSCTVIGDTSVTVGLITDNGEGTLQFSKNSRLRTIDVIYIPTNIVGGGIKNILRVDMSDRAESPSEESPATESVENKGSTEDDQTGPN